MACATEYHGFAVACCHDLGPTRFFTAFVRIQVFESTKMMDLNLICHMGCPTVFAYLGQKSLFEFRSVMPDVLWLVIEGYLDLPFQGDASPGCYQWLLSLTVNADLQSPVGFSIDFDLGAVLPVDATYRGFVFGR